MSENLLHLSIRALDELEHIYRLQKLLHIALEQLDCVSLELPSTDTELISRIDLLIYTYFFQIEPHFESLKLNLETIRRLKIGNL